MPTLNIGGQRVKVDDSFLQMTPEQQNTAVEEIAKSLPAQTAPQVPASQSRQSSEPTSVLGDIGQAAGDIARLASNGVTFGFRDKLAHYLGGGSPEEERAKTAQAMERAGTAGKVAELGGSMATPVGMASNGLTLARLIPEGAGIAERLLLGTGLMGAEGAGYGALAAAGNDQDIKKGMGFGALAGMGGNVAGEALSGAAGKIAGTFNKTAPTMSVDELKAASHRAYDAADQAGVVFNQNGVQQLRSNVVKSLTDRGFDPVNEPGVMPVLKRLNDMGGNVTLKGLDTVRKVASNGFIPGNKSNNAALGEVIDHIDNLVQTADPSTVIMGDATRGAQAIQEARSLWGRGAKLERMEKLVDRAGLNAGATGSGGNVENATRQQIKRLLTNENLGRGLTADEREAAKRAVLGSPVQNALRLAGKLSPQGNGLMLSMGVGTSALAPAIGIPAMLAGTAAKKGAEAMTKGNTKYLADLIASGGNAAAITPAKNAVQRLAETKRRAIIQALMGAGVNASIAP